MTSITDFKPVRIFSLLRLEIAINLESFLNGFVCWMFLTCKNIIYLERDKCEGDISGDRNEKLPCAMSRPVLSNM